MEDFITGIFGSSVCVESDHQSPEDPRTLVWALSSNTPIVRIVLFSSYLYILINMGNRPRRSAETDTQPFVGKGSKAWS